jgi:DNA polymerase III subunit gamma/tau
MECAAAEGSPSRRIHWPSVAETSLYRRHRPQRFEDVVGQEHVVRTLRNAVEQDRVHHAYLFVGSRGTGKTSMAKILARCLNCVRGPTVDPCGECESCQAITAGTSLDVIEMDAASNRSVDDIRELRERVGYVPAAGRWKVYIIDEAHMLTREAWNAFLKTLEEPPPNTVFVLATTEAHKVMPTIVDRCQRFDFQRPAARQIAEVLDRVTAAEGIEIADDATSAIARAAGGSFRDALGTLDQLVAYGGSPVETGDVLAVLGVADAELIFAAADAIADEDGRSALETVERLARSGRDSSQFIRDLIAHLRQLLVIRTAGSVPDAFTVTASVEDRLRAQSERIGDVALVRSIDELSAALSAIREGDDPRTGLELALLKAARPDVDASREALAARIERLERGFSGPVPVDDPEAQALAAGAAEEDAPEPSPGAPGEAPEPPEKAEPGTPRAIAGGAPGAETVELDRITGLWPAVLDHVGQSGSELLSAVFQAARPVAVDAERAVLEVGFPPSAAFNKRKAEAQANRERLAEAVRTIAGPSLRPVYVLLDREDAEVASGSGRESAPSEEELIERIKSEFDAEEYGTEERSG